MRPVKAFRRFGTRLIYSKHMLLGIGVASFLEATIVPIPLEAILIPLMQARREKMLAISTVALVGFLFGAVAGYGIGYFVFEAVGQQLVEYFASPEQFEQVRQKMHNTGFWFVFSVGVIPIPFQIAMLAAGATHYSLTMFLVASGLSRSIRYYGLALLVKLLGNRAQQFIERHKVWAPILLTVIVVGAWAVSTFL